MRKIIQAFALNRTDFEPGVVFAVCDDGSLWEFNSGEWDRVPDIPQEKSQAPREITIVETDVTNRPDWNIPNAEYSFTEFKEEV